MIEKVKNVGMFTTRQAMAEGNITTGETTPVPMTRVEFSPTDTGFLLVIGVKEKWARGRAHMKVSTQV